MTGFYPYSEKQAPLFPLNYNWFTEGFGTADLKDAKAVLDELAPKRDCQAFPRR
jgi:hypothetical protein